MLPLPNIKQANLIGAGGEGQIFEHPNDKSLVIKLYHTPRPASFAAHLSALSNLSSSFIKPIEVYGNNSRVQGFSMKYVNISNYWLFNNLFNKGFCTSNNIDDAFKVKVLNNLKEELEVLHTKGVIIGDLNQYNLFVSKSAEIIFVDVDSFQTQYNLHSGVLLDDIRDWTTNNISDKTDAWSYDILAFWATTFCHPFKWVVPGNSESLEQRVKSSKSILSKITGIKIPPLYHPPTGDVLKQFDEIFKGRRYMVEFNKTYVASPIQITQPLSSTDVHIRELYTNVQEVYTSGNYTAIKRGPIWTHIETSIHGVVRELREVDCDHFYPSETGNFAFIRNNELFSIDIPGLKGVFFVNPVFYYSSGYLWVLDYNTDKLFVFDISMQLAGISNTQIPIFAKSITLLQAPIQNFGAVKYLNVPKKDSSVLIELPVGTKDAIYFKETFACEGIHNNKSFFQLHSNKHSINLNYLPFFTVKDNLIFIPFDGGITVLNKSTLDLVTTLKAPCTSDSKLYSTTSGLLLLENNTLYLLNAK